MSLFDQGQTHFVASLAMHVGRLRRRNCTFAVFSATRRGECPDQNLLAGLASPPTRCAILCQPHSPENPQQFPHNESASHPLPLRLVLPQQRIRYGGTRVTNARHSNKPPATAAPRQRRPGSWTKQRLANLRSARLFAALYRSHRGPRRRTDYRHWQR